MTLNEGNINEELVIKNVEILGKERRRLYDLGLTPGSKIIKRFYSMFKDPCCYEVKSCRIAIRNMDAKCIRVERYNA